MSRNNTITSIDDLKDWFSWQKGTVWTMYKGIQSSNQATARICSSWDDNLDKQESWNLLSNYLASISQNGALVTIYLTDSKQNTKGGVRAFVDLPSEKERNMMGIGGPSNQAYDPQTVQGMVNERVNQELSREMKMYDLRKRNEDLESELQQKGSFAERMCERMVENGTFDKVIEGINNFVITKAQQGQGRQIAMNGTPGGGRIQNRPQQQPPAPQPQNQQSMEGNDFKVDQKSEGPNYSMKKLLPHLDRIQQQFPNQSMDYLLSRLADFIEENPSMAKSFLTQQDG